jgi:hypothetical protein
LSIQSWIDFWKNYAPQGDTAYHTEDLDELEKIAKGHDKVAARRWAKRLLCPEGDSCDVDSKLTPTPYVGNLKDASIVLAMLNPGIGEYDRIDHQSPDFQKLLEEQRRQDSCVTCFALGDPAEVGFQSWTVFYRRFLGPTLQENPNASWDSLAKKLAIVQLFPYYSKTASLVVRGEYFEQLPSVKAAKDAMKELLSTKKVVFRWKRQPARWGDAHGQGVCSEPRWGLSAEAKRAFSQQQQQPPPSQMLIPP